MQPLSWLCLLLGSNVALAQSLYPDKTVLKLNANNFKDLVLRKDRVSVVEFYAPWCGYCKQMAPEYMQSAADLGGIAQVAAVNCDLDKNKALCAHYNVKGFPTIKVFQPAKRTDVEFKDAIEGIPLERKPHKVYTYKGERNAKAINKYAIGKLRNYAATLEGDSAFLWLKPNKVPRVLMLTGKKYRGKQIAPLFKVLSSEYFGKMRFGVIPRLANGAWNLLQMEAPEDSQIVYLSDDRPSVMYKGKLTKKGVKKFIEEQYSLEMARREQAGDSTGPSRAEAANGFEWVVEDKQEGELEHVLRAKKEYEANKRILEENKNRIREKKGLKPQSASVDESASSSSSSIPAASSKSSEAADDVEEIDEFVDTESNTTGADDVEGETDGSDGADSKAVFDEIHVDWSQDEMINDGPEAAEAFLREQIEKRKALEAAQLAYAKRRARFLKDRASDYSSGAFIPGATGAATGNGGDNVQLPFEEEIENQRLKDVDSVVSSCMRSSKPCILLLSGEEEQVSDVRALLDSRGYLPASAKDDFILQYFTAETDELKDLAQDLGMLKRYDDGTSKRLARIAMFDFKRHEYLLMDSEYTTINISEFVKKFLNRKKYKLEADKIPAKYIMWVTELELEFMDAQEQLEQAELSGHEEKDDL